MHGSMPVANSTGQSRALTARAPARLAHLEQLEAESIHIIREAVAESDKPVMFYYIPSARIPSVLVHLALKAFYPAKP